MRLSAAKNKLPYTIHTVSISRACDALCVYLCTKRGSLLKMDNVGKSCCVIEHLVLYMSVEVKGIAITPDNQVSSEKEVIETEYAVRELEDWIIRDGETWIQNS